MATVKHKYSSSTEMRSKLFLIDKSLFLWVFFIWTILILSEILGSINRYKHGRKKFYGPDRGRTTGNPSTNKLCMNMDSTLKVRHKSCLLRPDTGPCRADIIQWYYDAIQRRCYRFYWGGCQGNGNKFETKEECRDYCHLNATSVRDELPYFCSLTFEYGDCFGHFFRWGWDKMTKNCKRYMYSGCGGNQNNFQTQIECMKTCISLPNNTLQRSVQQYTTCVPLNIKDLQ